MSTKSIEVEIAELYPSPVTAPARETGVPAQWRALSPNGRFPVKGKALVAIPIGSNGRTTVDTLVRSMGHDAFDYLFFAYDDTNWTASEWYGRPGVDVKRGAGAKWTLYYDHLTMDVVAEYTHLFLWDDDVRPAPGFGCGTWEGRSC